VEEMRREMKMWGKYGRGEVAEAETEAGMVWIVVENLGD
jgi:hypothetical protein